MCLIVCFYPSLIGASPLMLNAGQFKVQGHFHQIVNVKNVFYWWYENMYNSVIRQLTFLHVNEDYAQFRANSSDSRHN